MNYIEFAKATAERAVKTFAQTGAALLGVNATGLIEVDWAQFGSIAGLAAVVSIFTSIGSAPFGGDGPSLTHAEILAPPVPGSRAAYRSEFENPGE